MPQWFEPIVMTEQEVADEVSELCAKLRAARPASGLSVSGLAAAAGVAPLTVTRLEAGSVTPDFATFAKLAHASGLVVGVRHHPLGLGRNRFRGPGRRAVVVPGSRSVLEVGRFGPADVVAVAGGRIRAVVGQAV